MTDIKALFDADIMAADLDLDGGLLKADDGLETAVIISLFTDRRARPDDQLPGDDDTLRGWWGDSLGLPANSGDDRIGSRLWLLAREKQLPAVMIRAAEYAREALAWLIEDGVASKVDVVATNPRPQMLALEIVIHPPTGNQIEYRFDNVWQGQGANS